MAAARSNRKTHYLFETTDRTHVDTAHGAGFGAWAKMWDRTVAALFPGERVTLADAANPARMVVRRAGGELVVVSCLEVSK